MKANDFSTCAQVLGVDEVALWHGPGSSTLAVRIGEQLVTAKVDTFMLWEIKEQTKEIVKILSELAKTLRDQLGLPRLANTSDSRSGTMARFDAIVQELEL